MKVTQIIRLDACHFIFLGPKFINLDEPDCYCLVYFQVLKL